jgi:uncharacterized oligopeptide transporter (OPT) family protein
MIAYPHYFDAGHVAPVVRVYAATIKAGGSADIAWKLAAWAIPGAIIQFLGGPKRQPGVLLATGLPINFPAAGWAVVVGVVMRALWSILVGPERRSDMEVFAAGVIAGDALWCFCDFMAKTFAAKK